MSKREWVEKKLGEIGLADLMVADEDLEAWVMSLARLFGNDE